MTVRQVSRFGGVLLGSALGVAALAAEPVAPAPAQPAQAAQAAQAQAQSAQEAAQAKQRELEAARTRLDQAAREVAKLSEELGARLGDRFIMGAPPRAMLGVQVGRPQDGKAGAFVTAVSPGGPGEAAGIKQGDVITAIDGKDLTTAGDAGRALVEAMRDKEPDHKVKVKVLREGKSREVEVTPRAAPQVMAYTGGPMGPGRRFEGPVRPGLPPLPPLDGRGHGDDAGRWERGVPLAGMELATLSEGLGKYFGAKEGVLVVRAGDQDVYKLRDGDVLQSIDGREPNSASHATRILRSYQRGEKLQLKVLRDRKPLTLDVTLPGG